DPPRIPDRRAEDDGVSGKAPGVVARSGDRATTGAAPYPAPQEGIRAPARRGAPDPLCRTHLEGGVPMTRFATFAPAVLVTAAWLLPGGRATTDVQPAAAPGQPGKMPGPTKAICVMTPLSGSKVHGVVYFTQKGDTVEVTGKIGGLAPGLHGFHVHEFG